MTNEDYEKRIKELQSKVFVLEGKNKALEEDLENYRIELNHANMQVAYLRGYIHGSQEDTYDETII